MRICKYRPMFNCLGVCFKAMQEVLIRGNSTSWRLKTYIKTMEIWKIIDSLDGYYEASSYGRIRRAKPGIGTFVGRILKPVKAKNYLVVPIRYNGIRKTMYVHDLVCEAFKGPKPKGYDVNHKGKNGDKTNNCIKNLEYTTRLKNIRHCINVLGKHNKGCKNGMSQLKENDIIFIRRHFISGKNGNYKFLANIFHVSPFTIHNIVSRRTY